LRRIIKYRKSISIIKITYKNKKTRGIMKIKKENSESINSLRVICCLIVLMSHSYELIYKNYNNIFNELISFTAVAIFFYISGYVNFISYSKKKDPIIFWKARIKRIYPAYFIAVLLSFTITYFLDIEKLNYLSNYFFLQSWLTETIITNQALWSLAYEMFLYLIFPAFFVVRNKAFWGFLAICVVLIVFHKINALILLLCFLAGMIKARNKKEFRKIYFIPKIGKWTYEIYIFHFPILFLIIN
jgi:peptidoglycan/LPS O-acetylase OafA/YrhL